HEAELQAIKISDKVLTAGGLYAVVKAIDGDDITLEISKGIEVKAHRWTIREVLKETTSDKKSKNNKGKKNV
ncbi:MAG TPA: hypothetical protein DIC64_04815, partial [Alphaproteobacteria bacterium]|nr:hypothetical protein [Alphaproteobacteria bacterium]